MRSKEFFIVSAATILLLWLLGCQSTSESEGLSDSNMYSPAVEELLSSAFVVEGLACQRKATGSGFAVEKGILTNAHVVAGTEDLHVIDHEGNQYPARIVSFDSQTDLALLDVEGVNVPSLPIAAPEIGLEAIALVGGNGMIKAIPVTIDRLVDINIADIYGNGEFIRKGMQLEADISPGDSGGAIMDSSGGVVGLVFSRSSSRTGVSYAVSSEEFYLVTENISSESVDSGECLRK